MSFRWGLRRIRIGGYKNDIYKLIALMVVARTRWGLWGTSLPSRQTGETRQQGELELTIGKVQFTLRRLQLAIGKVQLTLRRLQLTIGRLQFTLGKVQFAIGRVQLALRNVQFTLGEYRGAVGWWDSCFIGSRNSDEIAWLEPP